MNPIFWPYWAGSALAYGLIAAPMWAVLRLLGVGREEYSQRLGIYPHLQRPKPRPARRVWLHAASLGEVRLAFGLLQALHQARPELSLVLSTGTKAGRSEADRLARGLAEVIYFPFDSPVCVRKALRAIRPEMIVLLETELWPIFLELALKNGVKVALINGRISDRTSAAYRYLAPGFRPILKRLSLVGAISAIDASRLRHLGVPVDRLIVTGNAKMDSLISQADPAAAARLAAALDLDERAVWVAGSIRPAEEPVIINAFRRVRKALPEAVLVIAPRHLRRVKSLSQLLSRAGLDHQLRSLINGRQSRVAPVIILDTMGELFGLYRSARVALSGGSLVPLGGQNPLEPAFWGVPVLFGPHMDDFAEASTRLLESGGARLVSAEDLADQVIDLMTDRGLNERMGRAARLSCQEQLGAVERSVEIILQALDQKG